MSKFIHTDRDLDRLTFIEGTVGALVIAEDHSEGDVAKVAVRREDAVAVAEALLKAAGVDAVIREIAAIGDDLR